MTTYGVHAHIVPRRFLDQLRLTGRMTVRLLGLGAVPLGAGAEAAAGALRRERIVGGSLDPLLVHRSLDARPRTRHTVASCRQAP